MTTKKKPTMLGAGQSFLIGMSWLGVAGYALYYCLKMAYTIRLQAIEEFGTVIHEYDPYFNYRATEYLYYNGAKKFFTWFDHKVWYPLGRPVGTTIYPGMQFTAVWIKNVIVGDGMTLNDICCYIPAWFGVLATFLVGCITYECTLECNTSHTIFSVLIDLINGRKNSTSIRERDDQNSTTVGFSSFGLTSAIFAMWIMGIVPAHLTRSVGGGYDNESVAVSAMTLTFYLWVRSLREGDRYSYLYGLLSGIAYFYMVATWGGYVFVLNLIGLHATLLVLLGRFSTKIYLSYSLFYFIGTALAIQVPVVGLTPLKSLEQMGPGLVFVAYQVIYYCERQILKKKLLRFEGWKFRIEIMGTVCIMVAVIFTVLMPQGYFGPISSRVRGLFVKHTKTGNPLVDSVAEHQPADNSAYFRYLQHLCLFAPFGFLSVLSQFGDAPSFIIVYAVAAYYFSHKMVRLILLMGPVASVLGGISVSRALIWCFHTVWNDNDDLSANDYGANTKKGKHVVTKKKKLDARKKKKNSTGFLSALESSQNVVATYNLSNSDALVPKRGLAMLMFFAFYLFGNSFQSYCWKMASAISNPSIIIVGQLRDGSVVKVDDYREAYWWIRDNTPEDARILSWWDYGYQITAIANRTTIADGNTWNHEHIALLGKILTTNVDEGYSIARHLADYVLIWTGGGPDDLAKSPHLARIANSVYRDLCPGDPTCRTFTFTDRNRTPSPMMKASFLYNLHSNGVSPDVEADPAKFREVFRSPYGKVRVYEILGVDEDSKSWVADPNNRICDVEGGWYCRGQYPPALKEVLDKKKDFAQLEDFNSQQGDEEYQKQYFENLNNPEKAKATARAKMATETHQNIHEHTIPDVGEKSGKPTQAEIDAFYEVWEDTELTTHMWKIISSGTVVDLESFLESSPIMGFMRSSDGRGPMWWAFESRKQEMVRVLMKYGVSHTDKDTHGLTPVDLLEAST